MFDRCVFPENTAGTCEQITKSKSEIFFALVFICTDYLIVNTIKVSKAIPLRGRGCL
jgi:hypothetical protein